MGLVFDPHQSLEELFVLFLRSEKQFVFFSERIHSGMPASQICKIELVDIVLGDKKNQKFFEQFLLQ